MKRFLQLAGCLLILQIIAAFMGPPRRLTDWLNGTDCAPTVTPRNIVVLGGGENPSGTSLIRTYYAAEFGRGLTGTTFVVALPTNGDPDRSSVGRMRDELVLRGIPAAAIRMESRGLDTHQQVANVTTLLGPAALHEPLLVVTSDFHVRRAVLYFRRAGFTQVAGLDAAGIGAEANPGAWAFLRYGLWSNLIAEIKIVRELLAIGVGTVTGW